MTKSRPVKPGDCTMAQKRCYGQEMRLRPDRDVVHACWYALGYVLGKDTFDIQLHDAIVEPNHDHEVATDPNAQRPAFLGEFHSLVARAVNSIFGDTDSLWSGSRHSAPVLQDPEKIFDRCVYCLANPVKDGLVRRAQDWPGLTTYDLEYGVPKVIKKPAFFFSDAMPDEVSVTLTRPPGVHPELSDVQLRQRIRAAVKGYEYETRERLLEEGRTVMGVTKLLRQSRTSTPYRREEQDYPG